MAFNPLHDTKTTIPNYQNGISKDNKLSTGPEHTSAPNLKSDILIGSICLIVLTLLFALLAFVVSGGSTNTLDSSLELGIHKLDNPVFDLIFQFFTAIGGFIGVPIMATIVGVVLFWRGYKQYIIPLAIAVGGGILLDELLKQFFRRIRPDLWQGIPRLSTFSFPSGHATVSTCFFGFMIWLGYKFIQSRWGQISWTVLMLVAIVLVGMSRIYLGEHYPSDVIGGFLTGSWLLAVIFLATRLYQNRRRASFRSGRYDS